MLRRQREAHPGGGRGASAAVDHHACARPRAAGRGSTCTRTGPQRRRVPRLQRRPHQHGPEDRLQEIVAGAASLQPPWTRSWRRRTRAAARTTSRWSCSRLGRRRGQGRRRARARRDGRTMPPATGPPASARSGASGVAARRRASRSAPTTRRRQASDGPGNVSRPCSWHWVLGRRRGRALCFVAAIRSATSWGTDDRGLVALYRGLPYELPLDIEL